MLLTALAIAPGLAICFYFFYKDAHNPEPPKHLLLSFLLGMAAVLPAALIEFSLFVPVKNSVPATLFTAYLVVGLVEESCKFLVLRSYAFTRRSFDEPLDGIVYSVMISMGFATVENAGYIWRHGFEVAFLRMFTSVPAHASFAVVMGYFVGKAKFDPAKRGRLLLWALFSAAAIHGTYDAFLLLSENHWLTQYVSEVLLFSGAILSLLLALHLSRRMVRLHYRESERLFLKVKIEVAEASFRELDKVHGLVAEAILEHSTDSAASSSVLERWRTPDGLRAAWVQGCRFLVVYRSGIAVGFVAFDEYGYKIPLVLYLYVLPLHRHNGAGSLLLHQATQVLGEGRNGALDFGCYPPGNMLPFFAKRGWHLFAEKEGAVGMEGFLFMKKQSATQPGNDVAAQELPLPV